MQERAKWHELISSNVVIIKFHNKYWVAVGGLLKRKDSHWGYLVTKGCLGFAEGFNKYSITGDESMSLPALLYGLPHWAGHTNSMVSEIKITF